jgi:isoamylase
MAEIPQPTIRISGDPRKVTLGGKEIRFSRGRCLPWGASYCKSGEDTVDSNWINFAVFSSHVDSVSLIILDYESGEEVLDIRLVPDWYQTGEVWHIAITGLIEPLRFAWRVTRKGHSTPRLLDPYAKAMSCKYISDRPEYHGLFPIPSYSWKNQLSIKRELRDLVIYEMHVRGFSKHKSAGVSHPGTYRGVAEKVEYLKLLGVNAVELMPVHEFNHLANVFINPNSGEGLNNYWGYDPLGFMAPNANYAIGADPIEAVNEFREMVDVLHGAGIEVILDVVLNHTGEGSREGPTLSMRGLDENSWYMNNDQGNLLDYSGCGNSLNCNHPVVREFIVDVLRHWVVEMGVDGFRFDLAAVLGRDTKGNVLANPPVIEKIALDPVFADTKLIAEAWDAAGLYQVGSFPAWQRWAEWNGPYRDDVRRFIKGEKGMVSTIAARITGSADIYQKSGRCPGHSVNFFTCHDGFTLNDLVSFANKHNDDNGEFSRDGMNENHSSNYGFEGESNDPGIRAIRQRQQRNFFAILLLSQGVPMILAGDEFGRTQQGNNNAWSQDNEISWIDWQLLEKNAALFEFVRSLIRFRKSHSVLRRSSFFSEGKNCEISWHGVSPGQPDFSSDSHALAFQLHGDIMRKRLLKEAGPLPNSGDWNDLYIAFNFWSSDLRFTLPACGDGYEWRLILDTKNSGALNRSKNAATVRNDLNLLSHSIIMLERVETF